MDSVAVGICMNIIVNVYHSRINVRESRMDKDRDTGDIGYTIRRTKTETLATLGTKYVGQRQRHWRHWVHNT